MGKSRSGVYSSALDAALFFAVFDSGCLEIVTLRAIYAKEALLAIRAEERHNKFPNRGGLPQILQQESEIAMTFRECRRDFIKRAGTGRVCGYRGTLQTPAAEASYGNPRKAGTRNLPLPDAPFGRRGGKSEPAVRLSGEQPAQAVPTESRSNPLPGARPFSQRLSSGSAVDRRRPGLGMARRDFDSSGRQPDLLSCTSRRRCSGRDAHRSDSEP
jgi:hypothetical protein